MATKKEEKKVLRVTSMAEMASYKNGCIVELPPFGIDQPFVARLRRPSLLSLVEQGKIPNSLLGVAEKLFSNSAMTPRDTQNVMKDMKEVIDLIVNESLIEPTYQEIKDAGIELCDDQLSAIFNYSQNGVQSLENFRKK